MRCAIVVLLAALGACHALVGHCPRVPARANRAPAPSLVHSVKQRSNLGPTRSYLESTTAEKSLAKTWIDAGIPKWVTLVDEVLFVIASVMFVRGSFDFLPGTSPQDYLDGCTLFIIGSMVYLALALFEAYERAEDAKLQGRGSIAPAELVEQMLYVLGSAFFLIGTVLFTPNLNGSDDVLPALVEGAGDEAQQVTISFLGRQFFLASGSLPEVPDSSIFTGDQFFVLGSVLFSVAAFVSALIGAGGSSSDDPLTVLRRRTSIACASLYELGGVAFVVGTIGYIPASTIGIGACPDGARTLQFAGGTMYIAGSVLYLIGSLLTLVFQTWQTYKDGDSGGFVGTRSVAASPASPMHSTVQDVPELKPQEAAMPSE